MNRYIVAIASMLVLAFFLKSRLLVMKVKVSTQGFSVASKNSHAVEPPQELTMDEACFYTARVTSFRKVLKNRRKSRLRS